MTGWWTRDAWGRCPLCRRRRFTVGCCRDYYTGQAVHMWHGPAARTWPR